MHHKFFRYFFVFFIFFCSFLSNSQEKKDKAISLIIYLQEIENTFDIKFSYVDTDLHSITMIPVKVDSLAGVLYQIKEQTQLQIKQLNNRYYTITSANLNLCGTILDNFETTLEGVTIKVLETNKTSTTDANGHFLIENVPRKAVIEIRHLGFKPYFISAEAFVKNNPCNSILLSQTYQQLDEVIIYKFLTTGISRAQDASIVLKTNDFGILPGLIEPDVLQTVQALPGIESIDETVSDINIRGGTNDQNLLLWDGIKMYQSGHFFGLISAFNPYLLDNVTIIKNGTSAAFGDGVSGVINMKTKNSLTDTFFGGAGLNLISGDVFGQIPFNEQMAFQFSGRRAITDLINTPTYNRFFERAFQDSEVNNTTLNDINTKNENFYFYDFTGKFLYDINQQQKLRLSFITMTNSLAYQEQNSTSFETTKSGLEQTNFSIGANLESNWNSDFSTYVNMYYTSYNLNSENILANSIQELYQNNKVLETALQLSTSYNFSALLNWQNGYQFNEVGITNFTNVTQPPFRSNIKGVIRSHALFSEINYVSENKKLWARIGVRMNYSENINTFKKLLIEPRVNFNYSLTETLKVDFQGEFKNQTTHQVIDLKQNFLGIEKRRWVLSDENLLPITRSKQASLGISFDENKLHLGIEAFYKFVNGISTATQGFQNENQFNGELGNYSVNGLEFLINQKTKTLSNWLSYTYNNNNYNFDNITPSSFPNNLDITHTLTFASTYTYENIKLGIGLNYRTGRPFTKPQEGNNAVNTTIFPYVINYESPNSSRLTDYFRADASLIYDFNISHKIKATIGASILNLWNKKNILNTYYRLNDTNEIETIENVSLGITPNISFRVFF